MQIERKKTYPVGHARTDGSGIISECYHSGRLEIRSLMNMARNLIEV